LKHVAERAGDTIQQM